ncbi:MAG TPA: FAD-binding oxidoreductase [Thermoanaerobaculia bacterium]|jgi:glycolate oxidase FAD binding subunit|nr:FAD-binding oxidoreductase [Thermoanaerobaculia bacterium]
MPAAVEQVSWAELAAVLGEEHLRAATAADAVDGVAPRMIAEPGTAEELARCLRWARGAGLKVTPRGGGTKLGWGNPPAACDLLLSTARLDRVREHAWADMTVIADAGCRVADLQRALAEHGQHLAIDPLWPKRATLGGILSTNDSGTLRLRYGSLRDLVIGITVALPDGTLAKSGGKVVKNVAGYDLAKLFTGALGTLGVIVEAIFRLHPLPRQTRSLTFRGTPAALNQLLLAILASRLTPTGLQLRAAPGGAHLDVRFDGTAAGILAQIDQVGRVRHLAAPESAPADAPAEVWTLHQAIWEGADGAHGAHGADAADGAAPALVARLSVLPARIAAVCALVERAATARALAWQMVVQGVGAGYLRLAGNVGDEPALRATLLALREELGGTGGTGGSGATKPGDAGGTGGTLVALGCPLAVKRGLDVWGPAGDAQPVMVRLKQRFDPDGTLSPGRFLGGI